jgi:hypothetical protein
VCEVKGVEGEKRRRSDISVLVFEPLLFILSHNDRLCSFAGHGTYSLATTPQTEPHRRSSCAGRGGFHFESQHHRMVPPFCMRNGERVTPVPPLPEGAFKQLQSLPCPLEEKRGNDGGIQNGKQATGIANEGQIPERLSPSLLRGHLVPSAGRGPRSNLSTTGKRNLPLYSGRRLKMKEQLVHRNPERCIAREDAEILKKKRHWGHRREGKQCGTQSPWIILVTFEFS